MKFIADCHLGKIAKYLRIFGFDTLYFQTIGDNNIINIAKKEERITLTSDKGLFERVKGPKLYIPHGEFKVQLEYIFLRFDLLKKIKPFSRCIRCNGELEKVNKNEVIDDLLIKTKIFHDDFQKCTQCGRIYWHGDHYHKMYKFVNNFIKELE